MYLIAVVLGLGMRNEYTVQHFYSLFCEFSVTVLPDFF
jgi:hypothetical protein